MKAARSIGAGAVGAVVLLLAAAAADSVYSVGQAEQAVMLRLGSPVAVLNAPTVSGVDAKGPGLHLKWPFVERLVRFDRRDLPLNAEVSNVGAAPLSVDAYVRYSVVDPLRAYRAAGDGAATAGRLADLVSASLRRALAGASASDIEGVRREAFMHTALAEVQPAAARLGVEVVDLGLLQTRPTDIAASAIFRRMQADEASQAAAIRSSGEVHSRQRLADADREAAAIRGQGVGDSLRTRGDGDAERIAILGAAYARDPSFARFFRRIESYDAALNPENTTLVLSPSNAFLDAFGHGPEGDDAGAQKRR